MVRNIFRFTSERQGTFECPPLSILCWREPIAFPMTNAPLDDPTTWRERFLSGAAGSARADSSLVSTGDSPLVLPKCTKASTVCWDKLRDRVLAKWPQAL